MKSDAAQVFNFLPMPTDVYFGAGVAGTVAERVRAIGGTRILIVTDPGVRVAGPCDIVAGACRDAGIPYEIFDDVTADSGSELICRGLDALRACGADAVVGLGGGSALDTAKAIAVLATNPGPPLQYTGLHKVKNRALPFVAIPTTAGTGSEVSLWSVFTDDRTRMKVAIGGVPLYPAVALCDPALTTALPPALTASTGMDALAHAIECYTNKACQPISAALAHSAIESIGAHLEAAVANGENRDARYGMLLASTMAGMAMNPTRLGLAHALAMPLGSWDLKIPHSLAVAVTLPIVMAFNAPAAPRRFAEVARALGAAEPDRPDAEAATQASIAVRRLADATGIPARLGSLGLTEAHVPRVVEEAMKSGNVTVNPRATTHDDLTSILRQAL
jgi:alcohol dehydrogenase class IV